MLTVVAAASLLMFKAPVPELIVKGPLVEVTFKAPVPDRTVVAEVELVEPNVVVFTPAPVPIFKVFVVASVDIPTVPVPEFAVMVPLVVDMPIFPDAVVRFKAPLPD